MSGDDGELVDFRRFCDVIAIALSVSTERVETCGSLVPELGLDELSLARVVQAIEDLNPYFFVPDQLDVDELTVHDLYHYYRTLTSNHVG